MSDLIARLSRLSPEKKALLAKQLGVGATAASRPEPLAIVGMGCRFPGGADSPQDLWRLVWDVRDAVEQIPADRWEVDEDAAEGADPNVARWGGWLSCVEDFDSQFFGLAPRECEQMDPQQRLVLEVCWDALEDAGQTLEGLAGSRTGVYVGTHANDYAWMVFGNPGGIDAYSSTGTAHSVVANRVSYLLDLRGPSLAVDTACSSSLVAVQLAAQALRQGECDLAVACGVNLLLSPLWGRALTGLGMLSPAGRCRTFDAMADGIVRGEGCGSVVLKRLSDARAAGDPIWAVIRGGAVNQDGRTNGLTAPSGLAQQSVLRAALADAGVEPSAIGAIEAHGTGTELGDPIEVEALAEVLGQGDPAVAPCVLGSVKTNIGHLEGAAGIAGIIKLALCLHYEGLPGLVHFDEPNPLLTLAGTRFVLQKESRRWPRGDSPRLGGVSAFGFGGTNAHLILEEAPAVAARMPSGQKPSTKSHVLALSARSPQALRERLEKTRDWLGGAGLDAALEDVCFTAWNRRTRHEHGVVVVGESREELAAKLGTASQGASGPGIARVHRGGGRSPGLTFVFSGQGTQHPGMGLGLRRAGAAGDALERCDAAIRAHAGWSVIEELERPAESSRLASTEIAQPAIFAVQVALAAAWGETGIEPDAVVGHSVGEIAAAHVAGRLSLEDAARVVVHRARLMERARGAGRMLAVQLSAERAGGLAEEFGVALAAVNGPGSCVLSGEAAALEEAAARLEGEGILHRLLAVEFAFHSAQMDPFVRDLPPLLAGIELREARTAVASTVSGALAADSDFSPEYWARNVRETVRFADAIGALAVVGHRTFVEIGPHPALLRQIDECAVSWEGEHHSLPSLHRDLEDRAALRCTLGALHLLGYRCSDPDVEAGSSTPVRLPGYPWDRQRFPLPRSGELSRSSVQQPGRGSDPVLGRRLATAIETWEQEVSASSPGWLGDHRIKGRILYPVAAVLASAFAAGARAGGAGAVAVEALTLRRPFVVPDEGPARVQVTSAADGTLRVHGSITGDAWEELASARLGRFETSDASVQTLLDPEGPETEGTSLYARLAALGAEFGPAFRGVRSFSSTAGRAVAEVVVTGGVAPAPGALQRDPPFLDACLQVATGALLDAQTEGDFLLLPVAIERAWGRPTGADRLRVEAAARDLSRLEEDGVVFDIRGYDTDGLALEITGVHLRPDRSGRGAVDPPSRLEWVPVPVPTPATTRPGGEWLILADRQGVGGGLARALTSAGERCLVALAPVGDDAPAPEALRGWVEEKLAGRGSWRGVVYMWGLDEAGAPDAAASALPEATRRALEGALATAQALAGPRGDAPPRLWLVERGACAASPGDDVGGLALSSFAGFARVVALEHPELRVARVDLDPSPLADVATELATELLAGDDEIDVALRHGARYVGRIRTAPMVDDPPPPSQLIRSPARLIEELGWVPTPRRNPGAGEIEIRVLTAGLNFRDVLNALGLYPGPEVPLGNECVGEVVAVGQGVRDVTVGDVVVAVAFGSLGDYATTAAGLAVRKPATLSISAAATIPIAYLTAYYALVEIGALKAGERVLIHAGAGGVGLAAVRLALRAGAEVFATAGSDQKRAFLRDLGVSQVMDSRSLQFAEQVAEATSGEGVDVLLNSLSGDFVERGFGIVAKGGRFLELGKRDIWTAEEALRRRPDVDYRIVYLGEVCEESPDRVGGWLAGLVDDVAAGRLEPLPCRVFARDEAQDAFRHMAQAHHVGKVALEVSRPPVLGPEGEAGLVRPGSTHLVTGGLGGVGLVLADWLAARGAGAVVLAGRSEPTSGALAAIEKIRERGAQVEIFRADVGSREDVVGLLGRVAEKLPPLAGVWHAAGVVEDAALLEQDPERFARVLAPKVGGAWYLHELTADHRLDAFVLFSSAASLVGWPGQSNYASANAVLDALAQHRSRRGLPALSINWGAWAGAGMAARLGPADRERLARRGLRWLDPRVALDAVPAAAASGPQVGLTSMDWAAFCQATASDGLHRLVSEMVASDGASTGAATTRMSAVDLADEILSAPASRRRALLTGRVRDLIVRTLGLPSDFALDPRQGLRGVGLDSLMAVELRNSLQGALGRALPSTLLFDHPTLEALGSFLLRVLSQGDEDKARPPVTASETDVGDLSDEEAEAALRAELAQIRGEQGGEDS